jgi:two-component system chemotaxis sensor kinase CheA
MNRVGELVLLRNQIVQYTNTSEDSGLLATSQRLNLITTELQESVMKTRMQPIGNVWGKFPRTVRDVALACGKQVQIEMEGSDTELDKTIIEAIKDPLTHLVRNAVDHGVESPADRLSSGKDPCGRLVLRAFHEGGQVNIEITDDGAGLNYDRIRNKAVQKGLVTSDQAARMSEREISNLIFLPGFSTAEKITNVSGRGVGLDVVKTKIEKIGGVVDVQSKPGQGTTVRMKIPLTLAIIPALVVTTAGDRYAIPQVNLLELVRLEGEQARKGIELVHGAPVHRLRGRLLPLLYLNRELQVGRESAACFDDSAHSSEKASALALTSDGLEGVNIVVLHADDRQFGLVVDEINDTEEIVVKPLGKQLKSINAYAGATIMGDGKVALILDVLGLAQRARVVGEMRDRSVPEHDRMLAQVVSSEDAGKAVLLFQIGDRERMAIELSQVARLEEFAPEDIEITGGRQVVQYRGQIMPLLAVSELLGCPGSASSAAANALVVVYTGRGHSVGLVIDRILDIVEEHFQIQPNTARPGVLGSAVIQQRTTEVLDIPSLLASTLGVQAAHSAAQAAHA